MVVVSVVTLLQCAVHFVTGLTESSVCGECVDAMLNVVPATHTLRGRHFLVVDKNKPREPPARPTNTNSNSQAAAPAGGNSQNQQQPPPDLVCLLLF